MSIDKMCQLADEFMAKIAAHNYEDNPPPNVKASELDWIDEETRKEIKSNGKDPEYKPFDKAHNPPGAIASEKTWDKAKKAVKKHWKKYDEPWAVVYHVYRNMGGKPKKKSKKSS
jgi:hypothetical protein